MNAEVAVQDTRFGSVVAGLLPEQVETVFCVSAEPALFEPIAQGQYPNMKRFYQIVPEPDIHPIDAWIAFAHQISEDKVDPQRAIVVADSITQQRDAETFEPLAWVLTELLWEGSTGMLRELTTNPPSRERELAAKDAALHLRKHFLALGYIYWPAKLGLYLGEPFPKHASMENTHYVSDPCGKILFELKETTTEEICPPRIAQLRLNLIRRGPFSSAMVLGSSLFLNERCAIQRFKGDLPCWAPVVYILEPSERATEILRELAPDMAEPQRGERLFRGSDALEQLKTHLLQVSHSPLPSFLLGCPEETTGVLRSVARAREARLSISDKQCKDVYRAGIEKDPPSFFWHTSWHSSVIKHVSQDCSDALEQMGYRSHVEMERADAAMYDMSLFPAALLKHRPSVAVAIDHLRCENVAYPEEITHVCWVQDDMDHLTKTENIRSFPDRDIICVYSQARVSHYEQLGYKKVYYLPFGVNPDKFPRVSVSDADPTVAVINNLAAPPEPWFAIGAWKQIDKLTFNGHRRSDVSVMVREVVARMRLRITRDQRELLYRHALLYQRRNNIIKLAQILHKAGGVTVYGAGWGNTPLADRWRGMVSKADLPTVYAKHLGVLNQGLTVHPRVMECSCAGGLPIIEHWYDSPLDVFREGVQFDTTEQLCEILSKLRSDPVYRAERIEALRAEVLGEHTYQHCMKTLVGILREHGGRFPAKTP